MSVRKGDQDEGKLQVIEAAKNLLVYTYDKCVGKTFPKAERFLLPSSIWYEAQKAHGKIIRANRLKVTNKLEAEERLLLEEEAVGHLDELGYLIDASHAIGKITDDQADFWTGLNTTTQKLALKWLKSQREDYKEFLKE